MWTHFMDMHSGGKQKLDWAHIYIEAPESEARRVFFARFKRNPDRVTCTCCGADYSISEEPTIEQSTAYYRNCEYDNVTRVYVERGHNRYGTAYVTLDAYLADPTVKVIRADEIKDSERRVDVPEEGYVWRD